MSTQLTTTSHPSPLAVMAARFNADPLKLLDTLKATVFSAARNNEELARAECELAEANRYRTAKQYALYAWCAKDSANVQGQPAQRVGTSAFGCFDLSKAVMTKEQEQHIRTTGCCPRPECQPREGRASLQRHVLNGELSVMLKARGSTIPVVRGVLGPDGIIITSNSVRASEKEILKAMKRKMSTTP